MGGLDKKLAKDLTEAIRSRDKVRLSTLRLITASLQNLTIEKKLTELKDEDVLKVIARQVKQRQDSIESFKKGGRSDLVEQETKELEVLMSYLPEQVSEKEIEETVRRIIAETGADSKKDLGKVMKSAMQELKGRCDGKILSSIVQKVLAP